MKTEGLSNVYTLNTISLISFWSVQIATQRGIRLNFAILRRRILNSASRALIKQKIKSKFLLKKIYNYYLIKSNNLYF